MDVLTWAHIGVLVAFASLCATIWKLRKDDWKEINNRIDSVSIALAAFKLDVSGRHPTIGDLADAERRFFEANSHTIAAINRLSDRIDRMLEREK
jgi:hypothetical protein